MFSKKEKCDKHHIDSVVNVELTYSGKKINTQNVKIKKFKHSIVKSQILQP